MLVEIDSNDVETLKMAERLLSDSEDGKNTIKLIKSKQTEIEKSRAQLKDLMKPEEICPNKKSKY
jgi:hypothetical protein